MAHMEWKEQKTMAAAEELPGDENTGERLPF